MKRARALSFVQKRIAEVRAERRALPERSESEALVSHDDVVNRRHERSLLRGEVEPEVVVAEDGTVRLASLEWSTEASDGTEQ